MITVLPDSWIHSYCTWSGSFSFAASDRYRWVILFTNSPEHRRPYQFSWRPPDTPKNLMGNRETDHLQGHGQLMLGRYTTESVDQYAKSVTGFTLQFPGEQPTFFSIVAPHVPGFSTIYMRNLGLYSSDQKHEGTGRMVIKTLSSSIFFVSWMSFTYDFHSGWTGSTEKTNCYVDFDIFKLSQNGFFRRDRFSPGDNPQWGSYKSDIQSEQLSDAILWQDSMIARFLPSVSRITSWAYYGGQKVSPVYDRSFGLKSSELSVLKGYLWGYMDRVDPSPPTDEVLGLATQEAAQAVRYFDGNTPVFLNELLELRQSIEGLLDLLRGEINLKSISSLYLNSKYGLRLTFQDTLDLGEAIARKYDQLSHREKPYSRSRGRITQDGITACCELYYDPSTRNGFAKVMSHLMEWDIFPSLQNIWDMVPYSFVVDWFADVEGFLNSIDTRTYLSVLEVFSCCYSVKYRWTVSIPSSHYGLHGRIEATRYKRFNRSTVIEPRPTFSGSIPSDHIAEGAALIIQRL